MNEFDPKIHHRRSIRLKGYDYAQAGAYFVTVVTWQRETLCGKVVDEEMVLNDMGEIVQKWWHQIPTHFPNVELGAFVIMPNHIHGIIMITEGRGAVPASDTELQELQESQQGRETLPLPFQKHPTLGQIVAYFKYQSTKEINALDGTGAITKFWQRNYYDRIIRNEREMSRIWDYIEANPARWEKDEENTENIA
ncbi:MAG: transposase [Anaerolineales bacterium]|uniref:Transposase n=1 Tax=Candidatus Desulfolinea nitratireducens TaxID=2841698 RepID=A0A8J6NHX5_9CHLR|nr:transposase [Candidatus Desulfolinea nitratireducens]MBL6960571.1 transposase [Anaerolineales bacterium]